MEEKKLLYVVMILSLMLNLAMANSEVDSELKGLIEDFQSRMKNFRLDDQLTSSLSNQKTNLLFNAQLEDKNKAKDKNIDGYDLLIFVSFSLPEKYLIELSHIAKKYNGQLVMRGLKNNSFKETQFALANLVKETQYGIEINPELFKRFAIQKVPTFVAVANNEEHLYDKIEGNVSVEYFLEKISQKGDLKNLVGSQHD